MAPGELAGTVSPGEMSEPHKKEHAPLGQPSAFSVSATLYKSGGLWGAISKHWQSPAMPHQCLSTGFISTCSK